MSSSTFSSSSKQMSLWLKVLEASQYCINKFVLTKDAVTAKHINSESTIQLVTFQYNAPISASIVWPMPVVQYRYQNNTKERQTDHIYWYIDMNTFLTSIDTGLEIQTLLRNGMKLNEQQKWPIFNICVHTRLSLED